MIRRLLAAVSFLTRVPVGARRRWQFTTEDVGRSTVFFPVVGAGLGFVQIAALRGLTLLETIDGSGHLRGLPPMILAVLLVALGAWLTGALHLDAVADMADGFGGGHTREDVLRIMRDHHIGAYGAVALVLLLILKVVALSTLIERRAVEPYLIVAPLLGRWATVPLGWLLPYARKTAEASQTSKVNEAGLGVAVTDYVGRTEMYGATLIAAVFTLMLTGWRGAACWAFVGFMTLINARWCVRRIGGVTGDTLGANTESCETSVLVVALVLT